MANTGRSNGSPSSAHEIVDVICSSDDDSVLTDDAGTCRSPSTATTASSLDSVSVERQQRGFSSSSSSSSEDDDDDDGDDDNELVPMPRPLVAGTKTIEILWKAGIPPFEWPSDTWEVVDWSCITVYEWGGGEGSRGGLCCVGHHPHRHRPVRTAWRVVPRAGRRGRSSVSTNVIHVSCFVLSVFKIISGSSAPALTQFFFNAPLAT